ncbi:MAG: domain S-box/diguanylate cyclase protein [Herbinix sp.]|jgi:diguanylate cyclase (GGDEF)-like protein|nr:domain S-box/diguanylate cyclase protein [Herbinix sp.]
MKFNKEKRYLKLLPIDWKKPKDSDYYLKRSNHLHAYHQASKISMIYGLLGIIWFIFPEQAFRKVIDNNEVLKEIHLMKGWVFVSLSVIIIFTHISKMLLLFDGVVRNLEQNLNRQKKIEEELHQLAYYDVLTKLPNRAMFEMKVNKLLENKDQKFAMVIMDVDNFKNINDSMGHLAGDQFLVNLSEILQHNLGKEAFVARMGGDEFAIIYENSKDKIILEDQVQHLLRNIRSPWFYEEQKFHISVSMGIVLCPEHGDNQSILLRNADIAMYAVKRNMKNNYVIFSEEMKEHDLKHIFMIDELHKAIDNEEFRLLYQPIINLRTGRLSGVEALIRWIHPEQGLISPMEFIPLAEETGLIHDIEKWVIETAFLQKKEWEHKYPEYPHLTMSINVSGKSIVQYGFVNEIRNLLMETNLNSNEIQLEITETVFIEKMNLSKKVLNDISNMGIQLALDDFGTGYSSLTYLKNLPIDVVKLDANFVKGITHNGEDSVIVESVIKLTHDLGLTIIAEGIETVEQKTMLHTYDCDYGQGYYYNKPVAPVVIEEMMINEGTAVPQNKNRKEVRNALSASSVS